MKKTIIWVILALISGAILGKLTFDKYEKIDSTNVISYNKNLYSLSLGAYKSLDDMQKKIKDFDRYVYIKYEDNYKAYIAFSKTEDNINKLKKIYNKKNIKTSIDKVEIDNEEFIQNLNEYEKLLDVTDDENSLLIIENQILACYDEVVVKDE